MVARLKVGVVGGGVGQVHIDAYKALPELYDLAAFCDIDAEKAAEVATRNDIGRTTASLDSLLDLDLDLIDLCTPSSLHAEQTLAVLAAGRNVIVEKPLAASLAAVDAILAAEADSSGIVLPIFQYRFANGIARLRHLMAKDLVGRAFTATAETHWRRTRVYYEAGPWRGHWDTELGGCLATHAIHIHDLLIQMLGPIETVYAQANNQVNGNETEDTAVLALTFRNGGLATSSVTLGAHPQASRLKLCFEGVTAESSLDPYNPGQEPWTFSHSSADGQRRIDEALADFQSMPERFVGQFTHIHRTLTERAPPPVTIEDSRAAIELLTAAYASILSGEAVRLPVSRDHPLYDGWIDTMKSKSA
ncbi:MAG: Gfo/Idh/MocA family oxidoreductase [Hyphomicrobiales bacterium]|nr:Gfo/Idh/MocA family oxidoreductase [Hyphomicrobiales bacterium]